VELETGFSARKIADVQRPDAYIASGFPEVSLRAVWSGLGWDFREGKIKEGARFGDLVLQINRADSANRDQHVHMVLISS
jgi:hypothetical protein